MATDIVEILRDMEAGRRNLLGDHWHSSYCGNAANEIKRLREELAVAKAELETARAETHNKQIYHPPCRY